MIPDFMATSLAALTKLRSLFICSRPGRAYLYSSMRLQQGWQQGVSNLDSWILE